jgi:serpin B
MKKWLCLLLVLVVAGCSSVHAADLMSGIKPGQVSGTEVSQEFLASQLEFAVELLQESVEEDKNLLISPLSVQVALSMTANGAAGDTLSQMNDVLGLDETQRNEYLKYYVDHLPSADGYKMQLANSIWYRDTEGLTVYPEFLQTNADFYNAQAYKAPFDGGTVKEINQWVKKHTDDMIDKIVDEIDADTIMYLINALTFDGDWARKFDSMDTYNSTFTTVTGDEVQVKMMHGMEWGYVQDDMATGFIKPYKDEQYSFVALLPEEDVTIYDYISSLTGEGLQQMLASSEDTDVIIAMPKFSYEYELSMNEVLKAMGMPLAFDRSQADFSKMAVGNGNIYIGDVLHKTFIAVDELGTEAAAVTKVEMKTESAMWSEKEVCLNRPFVYMIVDNVNNLPIFMGVVMNFN